MQNYKINKSRVLFDFLSQKYVLSSVTAELVDIWPHLIISQSITKSVITLFLLKDIIYQIEVTFHKFIFNDKFTTCEPGIANSVKLAQINIHQFNNYLQLFFIFQSKDCRDRLIH